MRRRIIVASLAACLYVAGMIVGGMFIVPVDSLRLICGIALQGLGLMILIMGV